MITYFFLHQFVVFHCLDLGFLRETYIFSCLAILLRDYFEFERNRLKEID